MKMLTCAQKISARAWDKLFQEFPWLWYIKSRWHRNVDRIIITRFRDKGSMLCNLHGDRRTFSSVLYILLTKAGGDCKEVVCLPPKDTAEVDHESIAKRIMDGIERGGQIHAIAEVFPTDNNTRVSVEIFKPPRGENFSQQIYHP